MRAHTGKALVAGIAATVLALGACSSSGSSNNTSNPAPPTGGSTSSQPPNQGTKGTKAFESCSSDPLTCNSGDAQQGGEMNYVIEKTVVGWNTNFTDSNVFEVGEVLQSVTPVVFIGTPELAPELNKDLVLSAEQTSDSPQTLVYKINPDAVWSDGVPIDVTDFQYQKDTSDGVTCPKCGASTSAGYDRIDKVVGSDSGKTVTVTMKKPFADWKQMFGPLYPAHIAKAHGGVNGAAQLEASFQYFDKNVPDYSGGPYIIDKYTKDTSIVLVPNPKWYGAVQPRLDKLIFNIITDQAQEVPALQNGDVDVIYSQPNQDLVDQANAIPDAQTYLGKGLVWEHLSFNEKNQFLSDKALRTAIFTAVDRGEIIGRTVGTFVEGISPMGNHIYVPGQDGYTDNVTSTGQGAGDVDKAKQLLTDAGYTGVGKALKTKDGKAVTFRCTYSAGNVNRQTTCEVVQATMQELGIKVTLKTTPDLGELGTGDYDLIVFAWVGAPFVVAGAQQIYTLKGGADYGSNDDPKVESLINTALGETDQAKVVDLMNQADVLLTADAYELPLFQKPTFMAAKENIVNIRDNATASGPPYNAGQWGIKAS